MNTASLPTDVHHAFSTSVASPAKSCPERLSCAFTSGLLKRPALLGRYAPLLRFCRSGGCESCARVSAMRRGGSPHPSLLPDGGFDPAISAQPSRVLVVDDTPVFLKLMEGIVTAHVPGVEVTGVDSAEAALREVYASRFDLVVSDFHMPGMSGGDLVDELRADSRTRQTPVILFTTEADERLRARALSHARTRWITKSPDRTEFARAVRELLFERIA